MTVPLRQINSALSVLRLVARRRPRARRWLNASPPSRLLMATMSLRGVTLAAVAVMGLTGCTPDAPPRLADAECDEPPATFPHEITADPNVNIVIVDRVYPQLFDFNDVLIWDGRLEHQALAKTFFCHRPERTALALEAPPGLHRVEVLVRLLGNSGTAYEGLTFDVKSHHELDVPEDGVAVLNLELYFGNSNISREGRTFPGPELHFSEARVAASHPR